MEGVDGDVLVVAVDGGELEAVCAGVLLDGTELRCGALVVTSVDRAVQAAIGRAHASTAVAARTVRIRPLNLTMVRITGP